MQNKYVGDVGDFGKYGLLRWLCGKPELADTCPDSPYGKLRLGVVWYLNVPSERKASNNDGKKVEYLCKSRICREKNSRYKKCDPHLYDSLKRIVETEEREVCAIRKNLILPGKTHGTNYYANPVSRDDRAGWLSEALRKTEYAQIVFIDPDKGIHSEKKTPCSGASAEHVYMNELRCFARKGKSLLIHHHFDRSGNRGKKCQQIKGFSKRLESELGVQDLHIYALWYSQRIYFVVAQEEDKPFIEERLESFDNKDRSEWCSGQPRLFTLYRDPVSLQCKP